MVTKVVPQATGLLEATAAVSAAATSVELSAVEAELAPPRVEAATFVPSTATAVKLEKP